MTETVCAVVVTFNRKELLVECIEALLRQTRPLDAIYIIDNASTDNTPDLLLQKGYINNIPPVDIDEPWEREFEVKNLTHGQPIRFYYVRMHENTGGAGGFYEGVKRGYGKGYDWLWLMDDDGEPDLFCLEKIILFKEKGDFLSPTIISNDDPEKLSFGIYDSEANVIIKQIAEIKKRYYKDTANPFNGTLISNRLITKIGFPKKEMFIWGDEIEYMLRANSFHFNIITVSDARHYHPYMRIKRRKLFGQLSITWQDNKLRDYCNVRNTAYIRKKYSNKTALLKYILLYLFALLKGSLTFREFVFFFRSFVHGVTNKWGEEKEFLE